MTETEASLWVAWRDHRDGSAFEALVRPHLAFASSFARRLGCSEPDADEVVQRSLIDLSEERRDKPLQVGLRAWMGRLVVSQARMLFRARRRRESHEARARVSEEAPAAQASALEGHEELERALEGLDPVSRQAVELRFLFDMEYREVGHVLGTSALACRLRVHRALGRMRERLGSRAVLMVGLLPQVPTARFGPDAPAGDVARLVVKARPPTPGTPVPAHGPSLRVAVATSMAVVLAAGGLAVALRIGQPTLESRPPIAAESDPTPGRLAAAGPAEPGPAGGPVSDAGSPDPVPAGPVPAGPAPVTPVGSLLGSIHFEDGGPLADAIVAPWGDPHRSARTDAQGRFRFDREWAGRRALVLEGARSMSVCLADLEIHEGATSRVDVRLVRGAPLRATLRGAASEPLEDVLVALRRLDRDLAFVGQGAFAFGRTSPEGTVELPALPAGRYALSAAAPGHEASLTTLTVGATPVETELRLRRARPLRLELLGATGLPQGFPVAWSLLDATGELHLSGRAPVAREGLVLIDAPPAGRYELDVDGLPGIASVRAAVVVDGSEHPTVAVHLPSFGSLTGTLRDAVGRVLPAARLGFGLGRSEVETDGEGRFTLPWIPAGRHTVYHVVGGSRVLVGEAEVAPGATAQAVLRLGGRSRVSGTVDRPARVRLLAGERLVGETRTDAAGRFELAGLAAGTYGLRVLSEGCEPHEVTVELAAGQELDLGTVAPRPVPAWPVVVRVLGDARLPTGVLVRRLGATPGGASGAPLAVVLDAEGRGRLRGLPPGTYRFVVEAEGFLAETVDCVLADGPPSEIGVVLRRP